uniref:RING-type domain-containing protein n=1 Tax=Strongyloides stercoralis TaxID=6248 RepID=A0A0K0ESH5_STRER
MFQNFQCTICTGDFTHDTICACPCGHTFHEKCVKKWLQHQTNCPICRKKCTTAMLTSLFFNIVNESFHEVVLPDKEYRANMDKMLGELNIANGEIKNLKSQLDNAFQTIDFQKKALINYDNLQMEVEVLTKVANDYKNLKKEYKNMLNRLKVCDFYQKIKESKYSTDPSILDEFVMNQEGAVNVTKLLEASIKENRRMKRALIEKQKENNELARRKAHLESEIKTKEEMIEIMKNSLNCTENIFDNYSYYKNDKNTSIDESKENILKPNVNLVGLNTQKDFTSSSSEIIEIIIDDDNTDKSLLNTTSASMLSPSKVSSLLDAAIASKNQSNFNKKDHNDILDEVMDKKVKKMQKYKTNNKDYSIISNPYHLTKFANKKRNYI